MNNSENNNEQELSLAEYRQLAELRYQIRKFLRFSEQAARAAGIEPQQHQLLLAVMGLPDSCKATIGEVAERLQIQPHTAVELVNRLEKNGLIQRERDQIDHRQVIVALTPKGRQLLHQLSLLHRAELQSAAPALQKALSSFVQAEPDETKQ
jgi:DNA-binding MarR family transcriptional regulator